MQLTVLFVERPFCVLIWQFIVLIILAGVVVGTKMYEFNKVHVRDYLVWNDPRTWDYDKTILIQKHIIGGNSFGPTPLQTQISTQWTTFFLYNARENEKSIWNKQDLIAIRDLENQVKRDHRFQSTCMSSVIMQPDGNTPVIDDFGEVKTVCDYQTAFRSVLDLFPMIVKRHPDELEDMTLYEIEKTLTIAMASEQIWRSYGGLFDKDMNMRNRNARFVRSMVLLAGPLDIDGIRYKNIEDRFNE